MLSKHHGQCFGNMRGIVMTKMLFSKNSTLKFAYQPWLKSYKGLERVLKENL
jgi:hypothetical protein